MVPSNTMTAAAAVVSAARRLRRMNLRSLYSGEGGEASTGLWSRYRWTSSARSFAVSYRRVRSFSIAFMTIQSRSPLISVDSRRGSVLRCWATVVAVSPSVPDLGAGLGRFLLADDAAHLVGAGTAEAFAVKGSGAGQEFIQDDAERVDVGSRVDVQRR